MRELYSLTWDSFGEALTLEEGEQVVVSVSMTGHVEERANPRDRGGIGRWIRFEVADCEGLAVGDVSISPVV